MRRANRLTVLTLLLLCVCAAHAWSIEHVGLSRTDRFLLCSRGLLGKPVYRDSVMFRGPGQEIDIPCGTSREALVEELRGSRTDRDPEEIHIVDLPDAVFLVPFRVWVRTTWKKLLIGTEVKNWDGVPDSRNLSPDEQAAISGVILSEARTTPLVAPSMPGSDGETAAIEVRLWLDAHRLAGATGVEAVIGILGEPNGSGRLIYGELRKGRYECLWDSPLFDAYSLQIGYRDMDGDGIQEILLSSQRVSLSTHTPTRTMLTIFDRQGHELTRQEGCVSELRSGYTEEGGACPIEAESIEFDPRPDGKRDILVSGRIGDPPEVSSEKVFRYSLVNGRYVVQQPPRRPARKAQPN